MIITALAGIARAWDLNVPSRLVLDEFWYARDGCFYWTDSPAVCDMGRLVAPDRDVGKWLAQFWELTPEHPPLAKWLIGAPMAVLHYGVGPARLSPLLAGTLTILLLYFLVRKAFGSPWIAAGASIGLAVDFPHFVHSRLAMLDIFTALFAVAAFLFIVLDREQIGRPTGHRWWAIAGAITAGAAAATKLSGAAVGIGSLLLILLWTRRALRGSRSSAGHDFPLLGRQAVLLIAVMVGTYIACYAGRLSGDFFVAPWAENAWLRAWWDRQMYMLALQAAKPTGISHPWDLPMTSPALVYFIDETPGGIREVLLFGNPLMWWGGFGAVAIACFDWATGRRAQPCELVIVGFLAGMAGWFSLTLSTRTVQLYHAIAVTPFVYVALAYIVARTWNHALLRRIALATLLIAIAGFVYYVPILNARPLDPKAWKARGCSAMAIWLSESDGCGLDQSARAKSSTR